MTPSINLHHLELFYYTVLHGGVSEAARKMPYGITPSSISKQLAELEGNIGARLFHRRPFETTAAGSRMFELIRPIFEELPAAVEQVRSGLPDLLRLAGAPVVLRDYLPALLGELRQQFPKLRFKLREGLQSQIAEWFAARSVDLAVTMLDGQPPAYCASEPLLELPLVLLVREDSKIRSAAELWGRNPVRAELVCPRAEDAITRAFRQGLARRALRWEVAVEVNSIELVEALVRANLGVGLSARIPGRPTPAGLRMLALRDFPSVQVGMLWPSGMQPDRVTAALMAALRREGRRMSALPTRKIPKDAKSGSESSC